MGYCHNGLPEYWLRSEDKLLFEEGKLAVDSAGDLEVIFDLKEQAVKEGWHLDPGVFTEITIGSAFSNQLSAIQAAAPEGVEIGITTWPTDNLEKSNYLKPSQFFCVSADCENPEEAVKVLNYITNSIECNEVLLGERGVPVSKKVSEAIAPQLDETNQEIIMR